MLFVSDSQTQHHYRKRSFLTDESATLAVIVVAIDFEWSVRRVILALGSSATSTFAGWRGTARAGVATEGATLAPPAKVFWGDAPSWNVNASSPLSGRRNWHLTGASDGAGRRAGLGRGTPDAVTWLLRASKVTAGLSVSSYFYGRGERI